MSYNGVISSSQYKESTDTSNLVFTQGVASAAINPVFKRRLAAYFAVYCPNTKISIGSGFRSYAQQKALYVQYGSKRAAVPGTSMHEYGLAVDINNVNGSYPATMEADNHLRPTAGVLARYGLCQPLNATVRSENVEIWHVQPIETYGNKDAAITFAKAHGKLFYYTQGQGYTTTTGSDYSDFSEGEFTPATFSDILLPSNFERRYGMSVYDLVQPLIKFSTASGIDATDAVTALRKYAKFIFHLMNASMDIATLNLPGAPWLRPGFNVWVDPVGIDKVYYVNKITHTGNAANNTVGTTLSLSFGRDRIKFQKGTVNFGAASETMTVMTETTANSLINPYAEPTVDIGYNSSNAAAVKWLQWNLKQLAYDLGSSGTNNDGIDGIYLSKTLAAVKSFKAACGLSSTSGVIDALTRQHLKDRVASIVVVSETQLATTAAADNVFVNVFYQRPADFGKIIASTEDFERIRSKCAQFYQDASGEIIQAYQSPYFSEFYGTSNSDSRIAAVLANDLVDATVTYINPWTIKENQSFSIASASSVIESVKGIQWILAKLGYYTATVDGKFGPKTEAAVKKFQVVVKMTSNGVVTPAVIIKLNEALANLNLTATNAVSATVRPMHGEFASIADIQNALNDMYARAPNVVKVRGNKLAIVIQEAQEYIKTHYEASTLYQ